MARQEDDDYRAVPSSDRGNDGYADRGMLGSYTPSREPFRSPSDVKFEAGYGASVADLERGYCAPDISEDPAYELQNYKYRLSAPKVSDLQEKGLGVPDDWAFQDKNRRARGFLTRPRTPIDR